MRECGSGGVSPRFRYGVLDGHFIIDLECRSIDLQPREGFVVPKGVLHRTRAPDPAVILMVETAAIVPTGDA